MMFGTPCEEYKRQPRARARDGSHLHPARGPRAKRLDLDRAPVRQLERHQPVCGHRRRRGLPVGPRARGRQRSLPEHAGRNPEAMGGVDKIGEFIAKVKDKNSGREA
jgi:hypothetical protein